MEVNNSAQPANLQELTLESGVCYWWNFGLIKIECKRQFGVVKHRQKGIASTPKSGISGKKKPQFP
jgi:hypothetical protein